MTAIAEITEGAAGDRLARRNALVLALAQGLAGGNNIVIVSTAGIIAGVFAGDKGLATVPASTLIAGMWMGTLPVGYLAKRYGRRTAYVVGAGFGALAGLTLALAAYLGSFGLLCLGAGFGGFYAAAHQSYRFAAADTASDAFKPRAISWVLAGGVFAGLFGSQLVIATKDIWPNISSPRATSPRRRSRSSPSACCRCCARRGRFRPMPRSGRGGRWPCCSASRA